jgi:hypothetical protein
MKVAVNTYGGLNQDASYDSIQPSFYIDALDMRITTTNGESQGSITNMKGTQFSFTIPNAGKIIGTTNIRNTIILFTVHTVGQTSRIYTIEYNDVDVSIVTGPTLVYQNSSLNFSTSNLIEAVGRFESANTQRIYWTDYQESLRSLNIVDPNVATTPIDLININPNIKYQQPLLTSISGGGSLLTGLYQCAYRLITFDGKETLISPPSNMIHVVSDSETVVNSARYTGDPKGTVTSKSLGITVDTTDYTDYEKIEFIILFHEDYNGVPTVKSIETVLISGETSVSFIYTGTEDSTYVLSIEDYTLKTYPFSTCKTLTQVDSSLIIGNLKGGSFSIQDSLVGGETFDVSTLRYNSAGQSMVGQTNFRKVGTPVYTDNEVKFNTAYNEDAHWDSRWHTLGQYKYKSNGTTLGGQSVPSGINPPNLSYEFVLEPMIIDEGGANNPGVLAPIPYTGHNLSDGYTYTNTTFDSPASPFISGLLKGYKRGETYRFAFVAYRKGEVSFAEFIGDIKFPDISEETDSVNSSGELYYPLSKNLSGTSTTAYAMGIQFTLDFTSCPTLLADIDSYQIVRVERKDEDKRRLTSGTVKVFSDVPLGAPPGSGWDLRFNGGSNVLHLWHFNDVAGSTTTNQNGSFQYLSSQPFVSSTHHNVFGDYISYISPELSYEFNNVKENILADENSLLLVTGGYGPLTNYSTSVIGAQPEQLGEVRSYITSWSNCVKVANNTNGYEYVKSLNEKNYIKFTNTLASYQSDIDNITPLLNGAYYLRNYYAECIGAPNLNNCNDSGTPVGTFFKGAQSMLGKLNKILLDPITGATLTATGVVSGYDDFKNTFVKPSSGSLTQTKVIADLLIPRTEIYGGYSDSALENNIFVPASPVIDKVNLTPKVFGGDIFINTFIHQTGSTNNSNLYYENVSEVGQEIKRNSTITEIFPIESSINLDLNYGADLKRGVIYDVPGGGSGIKATRYRQESNNYDTTYGKSTDMYKYNDVYSEQSTDLIFVTKPTSFSATVVNDIRTMISNVKINNEEIDSWTKFLTNNYYDVDDHGPINKVMKWKNNLYFFQDTAVGNLIVNPISVVTGSSGIPTNLGTGEGIIKHQYLSTTNGSIHQWGIKDTDSAIYYFDAISKKIFAIGQGNSPISEIKGMHSFLNTMTGDIFLKKENGGDNPLLMAGVTIGKDIVNDEVLITFKGINVKGGDPVSKTLVYDELIQQFSSMYSDTPYMYINNKNVLLSPHSNISAAASVYLHNEGDYGSNYGVTEECYVKLIVNQEADLNKVIRFIEFNSISRNDAKVINRAETITAFQIDTEEQSTGKVAFSADRFKRKFNKWRLRIPRDQNSVSQQGRLRNTYFIVTLYFDNNSGNQLILNRLLTYYDTQMF